MWLHSLLSSLLATTNPCQPASQPSPNLHLHQPRQLQSSPNLPKPSQPLSSPNLFNPYYPSSILIQLLWSSLPPLHSSNHWAGSWWSSYGKSGKTGLWPCFPRLVIQNSWVLDDQWLSHYACSHPNLTEDTRGSYNPQQNGGTSEATNYVAAGNIYNWYLK